MILTMSEAEGKERERAERDRETRRDRFVSRSLGLNFHPFLAFQKSPKRRSLQIFPFAMPHSSPANLPLADDQAAACFIRGDVAL